MLCQQFRGGGCRKTVFLWFPPPFIASTNPTTTSVFSQALLILVVYSLLLSLCVNLLSILLVLSCSVIFFIALVFSQLEKSFIFFWSSGINFIDLHGLSSHLRRVSWSGFIWILAYYIFVYYWVATHYSSNTHNIVWKGEIFYIFLGVVF